MSVCDSLPMEPDAFLKRYANLNFSRGLGLSGVSQSLYFQGMEGIRLLWGQLESLERVLEDRIKPGRVAESAKPLLEWALEDLRDNVVKNFCLYLEYLSQYLEIMKKLWRADSALLNSDGRIGVLAEVEYTYNEFLSSFRAIRGIIAKFFDKNLKDYIVALAAKLRKSSLARDLGVQLLIAVGSGKKEYNYLGYIGRVFDSLSMVHENILKKEKIMK